MWTTSFPGGLSLEFFSGAVQLMQGFLFWPPGARKRGRKSTFDAGFLPFLSALGSDNCARCWYCWGSAVADRQL